MMADNSSENPDFNDVTDVASDCGSMLSDITGISLDGNLSVCDIKSDSGGVFSENISVCDTLSNLSTTVNNDAIEGFDKSYIRNKQKRGELYMKWKKEKKKEKLKLRKKRQKMRAALGEDAPPLQPPKTIDNQREKEDTMVDPTDAEVILDEDTDELSAYFKDRKTPKVLITTCDKPRSRTMKFAKQLQKSIPNSFVFYRKGLPIKKIVPQCVEKEFTDIIVINEDRKTPNGMLLCHLPDGPTAHFKITNVRLRREIRNNTAASTHCPEVVLNNFGTRLGHKVGRMLAVLFPHQPEFKGRQVVTFHNQRDFIFFRFHRYIFRNEKRVGLQEIGPRFTLKLRSIQHGTFDSKFGEYEWIHNSHEMDTTRRKFHL